MKKVVRRVAIALGALILLAVLLGAGVWLVSDRALAGPAVSGHPIDIPSDPAAVAAGERLVRASLCADCHAEDLGGGVFIDQPPFMVLPAPNLTRGRGGVADADVADLERAIRHGVGLDGRNLVIMPADYYHSLTDEEIGQMIAWLRSAPPVDRELPPREVGPAGRMAVAMSGDELLPGRDVDHDAPHERAVISGSLAHGRQLTLTCRACHGQDLAGSVVPGQDPAVVAPNITPGPEGIGRWTEDDFRAFLATGRRPDGTPVTVSMPWQAYSGLTEGERSALWRYVSTVEPRPTAPDARPAADPEG